ncbi:hypothetical protein GCM10027290_50660 [Micromonospora sonneratiae]|uniref:Uncharacterized protein n=1 Tax=Micromonospora sonneratiae TaxID=1184706 RepID=A0ABW3Y9U8_9ACTN
MADRLTDQECEQLFASYRHTSFQLESGGGRHRKRETVRHVLAGEPINLLLDTVEPAVGNRFSQRGSANWGTEIDVYWDVP